MLGSAAAWCRAFVAASVLWALVLPLAPFAAQAPASRLWYALAFSAYAIGSGICHQLPARSFHLWSMQMPVCARCTGIYVGAAVAATIAMLGQNVRPKRDATSRVRTRARREWARGPASFLFICGVPTAATLVYEWFTGHDPGNWTRAVAGVPIGAAVALVVVGACGASTARRERPSA